MKLEIKDVHVEIEGKEILKGITLSFEHGKTTALMGPNGSGKSSLALTLMGHPKYIITKGSVILDGKDITKASPDERAKAGLFLSFQHPKEIHGVNYGTMLRNASKKDKIDLLSFNKQLKEKFDILHIDESFKKREMNVGLSGGEKKKMEMLQLSMLKPKYAILDEVDSGLDVDALKNVCDAINTIKKETKMGMILITHYNKILKYIEPDYVYVLDKGKIIKSGGKELAHQIEEKGFELVK